MRVAVLADGGPGWGPQGPAAAGFRDATLGERALALAGEFDPAPLLLCRQRPREAGPARWVRLEPAAGEAVSPWPAVESALRVAAAPVIVISLELPLVPRVWVDYLRRLALVHWPRGRRPAEPSAPAAIVPAVSGGAEPAAAVYHPDALPPIAAAAAGGPLTADGLPEGLPVLSIAPAEWRELAGADSFLRCAGPEDLDRAGRLAAGPEQGERLRRTPRTAARAGGAAVGAAAAKETTTNTQAQPPGEGPEPPDGYRMVDVGGKPVTRRSATAAGVITVGPRVYPLLVAGRLPKGDALAAAHLAAVGAVKRTWDAIPLCHPIPIEAVEVSWTPDPGACALEVSVTVRAEARTGVEMEALHGVAIFLLTVYDMAKGVDRGMTISALRLLRKSGGRSGDWRRGPEPPAPEKELA